MTHRQSEATIKNEEGTGQLKPRQNILGIMGGTCNYFIALKIPELLVTVYHARAWHNHKLHPLCLAQNAQQSQMVWAFFFQTDRQKKKKEIDSEANNISFKSLFQRKSDKISLMNWEWSGLYVLPVSSVLFIRSVQNIVKEASCDHKAELRHDFSNSSTDAERRMWPGQRTATKPLAVE